MIIGHAWNASEPPKSPCRLDNEGFLMAIHLINLIVMDVYLIVGAVAFLFTIVIIACEEGR